MELITIKTFDNPIDAHVMKSKLESEGVKCFLFDENVVGLNPVYNIAVGGIKLKILESDLEKAVSIIDETENSKPTNEKGEIVICPHCHSKDIYTSYKSTKGLKGTISILISFLLMVFPIYFKTVYKCKKCGAEFK
ncbi:MAG TPA: DUF2007 domain-containing protein [Flavobacteriales bacterium]|nr:DUF2007 domain-containing protein [Flavobacteriales bacterium]